MTATMTVNKGLNAVYLDPQGPLATPLPSPTLFGALAWAAATLHPGEDLAARLAGFTDHPAFVVSSAFPCLTRNGERLRFYPVPCWPEPTPANLRHSAGWTRGGLADKQALTRVVARQKRVKGAAYLSEPLFAAAVCGELTAVELLRRCDDERGNAEPAEDALVQRGSLLLTEEQARRFGWPRRSRPLMDGDVMRNEVDRVRGAAAEGRLFFTEELSFAPGAGLWFALWTEEPAWLTPLLRYLDDTGLGGEVTVGKGQFALTVEPLPGLPASDAPNARLLLGRGLPQPGEVDFDAEPLRYTLAAHRGKYDSLRHAPGRVFKPVRRMFEAGSVLPGAPPQPWIGRLVASGELAGHPVYVSGQTLATPAYLEVKS